VTAAFFADLAREAAARYPARDRFARGFAHGKLRRDPAFKHFLVQGLIPPGARVLDLGAGQGLLGALLAAVNEGGARNWPEGWAPAPLGASVRSIELAERAAIRARAAAGPGDSVVHGDLRTTPFGEADVCLLLDVLHYLEPAAQEDVLARSRAALGEGAVLLLRVADASQGLRFRLTLALDRLALALRGHSAGRYHCRPLAEWIALLTELGFRVTATPMGAGTPFANVLLLARYDRAPARSS